METQEQDLIVAIKPDMAKLYPTAEAVDAALRRLSQEASPRNDPRSLTERFNATYSEEDAEEDRQLTRLMKKKANAVLDPW